MVIAIISESRSGSVRNRDRHHLGTLIAIARNTQNWLRNEIDDSAKAHELRIKEATDFVTAYALNELTPDQALDRFLRYGHRWGEALPGTYAYSHSTNEQIIQAIDKVRGEYKGSHVTPEGFQKRVGGKKEDLGGPSR
jgi:hypothetical protein